MQVGRRVMPLNRLAIQQVLLVQEHLHLEGGALGVGRLAGPCGLDQLLDGAFEDGSGASISEVGVQKFGGVAQGDERAVRSGWSDPPRKLAAPRH